MLLPLQGVLLFSIRTPKALPWAMCFWGFQPVLLTFDTPSFVCLQRYNFRLLAAETKDLRYCKQSVHTALLPAGEGQGGGACSLYCKQSVHSTPLPAGEGLGVGLLHIIELREHLYAVLMVAHAACLAATVHSEDGIAHVDATQGY